MHASQRSPVYLPRSVQVAQHLKELFSEGHLSEQLPSERALAAQVGVGRDTLRAALKLLEDEGWMISRSREGTKVRALREPVRRRRTVGLLVLMQMEQTTYRTLMWIDEVRRLLYRKEIDVEVYDGYNRKRNFFGKLDREAAHDCWMLIYPNLKALSWMERTRVPAVVAGTIAPTYGVPSVDLHYRALCRHAAGRLIQLGHRHLVYIIQKREWGADAESIAGFREGVAASGRNDVTVTISHHDGSRPGICGLTDRLLALPQRPTGWMIGVAPHFTTVQMHLLHRGVAIPGEISLISQDAEPWQSFATPSPARYEADISILAKHTVRQILKTLSGKPPRGEVRRIFPDLVTGETLGPPPLPSGAPGKK